MCYNRADNVDVNVVSLLTTLSIICNRHRGSAFMSVTMRDVAKKANVSIKTVSRVVNDQGEISEETRQRVLEVINTLGYRPNMIARGLVTQRTYTVGLIVPDITNPFFPEVARGIQDIARANNYNVFLCNSDENLDEERRVFNSLVAQSVDGIIIFPTYKTEGNLESFAEQYRPIISINHALQHPNVGLVMVDNQAGARLAVDYLVSKGHTCLAMLTVVDSPSHITRRTQGFREALAAQGRTVNNDYILAGPPTLKSGHDMTVRLFEQHPEVTAIFAYNDLLALGALRACEELNRRVPADCAIIGFDDILLASMVSPALTTIRTDQYELGRQAMTLLLEMLNKPQATQTSIYLGVELVVRESA
jgi:LacI family transcriptional regulator